MLALSEHPCVVTTIACPNDLLWIRLVGEVEMGAEATLEQAVSRVRELTPRRVVIDLGGVTFAGSLLVHFLIRVHTAARHASLQLHHAKPTVRFILAVTGVDEIVDVDDHSV